MEERYDVRSGRALKKTVPLFNTIGNERWSNQRSSKKSQAAREILMPEASRRKVGIFHLSLSVKEMVILTDPSAQSVFRRNRSELMSS